MKKKILGIGALALAAIGIVAAIVIPKMVEPEDLGEPATKEVCVLCNAEKYPNLCFINLNTGAIAELEVYEAGLYSDDMMHCDMREFDQYQNIGTMNYVHCLGMTGARFTGIHTRCELHYPEDTGRIQKQYYCKDCYEKLSSVSKKGYLILDTYDLENIGIYTLNKGDEHSIRCFNVTVAYDKEYKDTMIKIEGTLEIVEGGPYGQGIIVDYPNPEALEEINQKGKE